MASRKFMLTIAVILMVCPNFLIIPSVVATSQNATHSSGTTTIWDTDQTLISDYTIANGETLIINPGVTVYLDKNVQIHVAGILKAEGTKDNMITFTHKDEGEYWWRIGFNDTSIDAECILKYCKIEYGGICCWDSSPTFSNNIFTNNAAWDIYCSYASPTITYNQIVSNNMHGINCYYSSPTISYNNISSHNPYGIRCIYSSPTISYNIISSNFYGVYCDYDSNPTIHYNNIYGNIYGISNYHQIIIDATYNWWGSADGPSGAGHGNGDNVSDYVDYDPWLTEPVKIFEEEQAREDYIFKIFYPYAVIGIICAVTALIVLSVYRKRKGKKKVEEIERVALEEVRPINVQCPYCQTTFQITPTQRPFKVKCPNCGKKSMLR